MLIKGEDRGEGREFEKGWGGGVWSRGIGKRWWDEN